MPMTREIIFKVHGENFHPEELAKPNSRFGVRSLSKRVNKIL